MSTLRSTQVRHGVTEDCGQRLELISQSEKPTRTDLEGIR